MRQTIAIFGLVGALLASIALPVGAQQGGIVIENNGIDSSDSAAGADNVHISRAAGAASANTGPGVSNEVGYAVKDKSRDRKERGERRNAEELAASVEEAPAAPADGDYAAYAEGSEWAEPIPAAPDEFAASPADEAALPIQLPNTGAGIAVNPAPSALLLIVASMSCGAMAIRRERVI